MKDQSPSQRATALVHQALDLLKRAERFPDSPVNVFVAGKERRELRRAARRLRQGQCRPRYTNFHSAEELADIYERTVRRDEMIEQALDDLKRITFDLARVLEENTAEVQRAVAALVDEMRRAAAEHGPASEAAHRLRRLQFLASFGQRYRTQKRRRRAPEPPILPLAMDPLVEVHAMLSAAEILDSPPPDGELVVTIPPDGSDWGRGRTFMRIGVKAAAWIGSFARGHTDISTVQMLPGDEHLFVSAKGAGYIIELKTRTLVETVGTDVVGVISDEPMTLFAVNHGGQSLEAFGRSGWLWKTGTISAGGFRNLCLSEHELTGEARQPSGPEWAGFSIDRATGEVVAHECDSYRVCNPRRDEG